MRPSFPFRHLTLAEVAECERLVALGAGWCRAHGKGPRLSELLAKIGAGAKPAKE